MGRLKQIVRNWLRPWPPRSRHSGASGEYAPSDLRSFESRVSSQNGEDGILREIFRRIGVESRTFVEFGVQSGLECNCALLARSERWGGLFLEADGDHFVRLERRYRNRPAVRCVRQRVLSTNIQDLLREHEVPEDFDLLSIDIDGNDYWVWQAIEGWRPRVVVIEYNAAFPPPTRWVMQENPDHSWGGDTYYGASLSSLAALGDRKGYTLVSTESRGVNSFFVRTDLVGDLFPAPGPAALYSPPIFGAHGDGHPPGSGPFVEI